MLGGPRRSSVCERPSVPGAPRVTFCFGGKSPGGMLVFFPIVSAQEVLGGHRRSQRLLYMNIYIYIYIIYKLEAFV